MYLEWSLIQRTSWAVLLSIAEGAQENGSNCKPSPGLQHHLLPGELCILTLTFAQTVALWQEGNALSLLGRTFLRQKPASRNLEGGRGSRQRLLSYFVCVIL
jgi:hypothetical protein